VPFLRRRIDEHLESAQAYLRRRGGGAVFFGRFTAALRVMVPGLAGMAEIPYGKFAFYNAAGGLLWGTGFVLLGYLAGAAWQRVAADASKVGLALLVLVLVGLVVGRVLRNVRRHGEPLPDRLARSVPVAWAHARFPRQCAWLSRRIDKESPRGFALSVAVVSDAVCLWVFIGLAQDVIAREEAVLTDPSVTRFVVDHRVAWATGIMKGVTWLGSNAVLIPLAMSLAAYVLLRKKDVWAAILLVAALTGANAWYHVVKPLVARARPPESLHLISVSGFAFPSGHATAAIAVWGAVAFVLSAGRSGKFKVAIWIGAGLIASLVAFSRVYLGVHWWTDVVAGMTLGAAWLCALVVASMLVGGAQRKPGPELCR
jgi:membrane-associated phospholipid phosphatase